MRDLIILILLIAVFGWVAVILIPLAIVVGIVLLIMGIKKIKTLKKSTS